MLRRRKSDMIAFPAAGLANLSPARLRASIDICPRQHLKCSVMATVGKWENIKSDIFIFEAAGLDRISRLRKQTPVVRSKYKQGEEAKSRYPSL